LILADEPTGNLDTKTGKIVLETFKRLNREEGRTIILITHDQEVAKSAYNSARHHSKVNPGKKFAKLQVDQGWRIVRIA